MYNPYYTHRPYLQQELNNLINTIPYNNINILELGVGDGSSELFHNFAKTNKNVSILGIESDSSWAKTIKEKYALDNYQIKWIQDWNIDIYKKIDNKFYNLVFIDQSPWSARIEALDHLSSKNCFNTAILHDYDFYNPDNHKYNYDNNSYFIKYINRYNLMGHYSILPPTLILKLKNEII